MNLDVSRIKLFAFDFDGTLVQSNGIKAKAYFDVVSAQCGGDESVLSGLKNILDENRAVDRYGIFAMLAEKFPHLVAEKLAHGYSNQCRDLILNAPEVPGAGDLLKEIKRSENLCVINSATPQDRLREIVPQMDIYRYCDEVLGAPKSKTENLRFLMSKFNISAEQILVIGDGQNDCDAARNIGAYFYGIHNEHSDLKKDENILHDDLTDLLKVIHV